MSRGEVERGFKALERGKTLEKAGKVREAVVHFNVRLVMNLARALQECRYHIVVRMRRAAFIRSPVSTGVGAKRFRRTTASVPSAPLVACNKIWMAFLGPSIGSQ